MDNTTTLIQVILCLFAGGGLLKIATPHARYVRLPFQHWAQDFKPEHLRLIGLIELVFGAGMIASLLFPSLATLAPFAATGIALYMAGAMATHLRLSEYRLMLGNVVYLGLALFVAYSTLIVV